jgi:hypothetical protein
MASVTDLARELIAVATEYQLDTIAATRRLPHDRSLTLRWSATPDNGAGALEIEDHLGAVLVLDPRELLT